MNNVENIQPENTAESKSEKVRTWQEDLASQPLPGSDSQLVQKQIGDIPRMIDNLRTKLV